MDDSTFHPANLSDLAALVCFAWIPLWFLFRYFWECRTRAQQAADGRTVGCRTKIKFYLGVACWVAIEAGLQILCQRYQQEWNNWNGPFDLPVWVHYLCAFCGYLSAAGIYWIHANLWINWSPVVSSEQVQHLVTTGPYRLCRHPMYLDILLGAIAIAPWAPFSLLWLYYSLSIAYLFSRIPFEDRLLRDNFGQEFLNWKASTPAVLPCGHLCCFRRADRSENLQANSMRPIQESLTQQPSV